MAQPAGTVYAEIRVALDKLQGDINKVNGLFSTIPPGVDENNKKTKTSLGKLQEGVTKGFKNMANTGISQFAGMLKGMNKAMMAAPIVGAILAIVATIKKVTSQVISFVNTTSQAFIRHQQEVAKLNSVLQTTGAVAWTTTRELTDMARTLAHETGRTVDEVMSLQTTLIKFGTVTGEAFDRATAAAVDMAAVMGKDLVSAANAIGRALEDPVQGLQMLNRQGIVFSASQRELIKTLMESGDQLGAQNLILGQLEGSFQGAAAAIDNVNSAVSRHQTAMYELQILRGEATSGLAHFFNNMRAGFRENQVEAQRLRNDMARAASTDFTPQIQQIERWTESVENARAEIQHLQNIRLTLDATEFDRQMREAQQNLQHAASVRHRMQLELDREQFDRQLINLTAEMRNLQFQIEGAHGRERQLLQEQLELRRENFNYIQGQLKATEAIIGQTGRLNAARQDGITRENEQLQQVRDLQNELRDVEQTRIQVLEEINRAYRLGLIDAEQAAIRRQSAYQSEAQSINIMISAMERLNLTSNVAISAQGQALTQFNNAMGTAVERFRSFITVADDVADVLTAARLTEYLNEQEEILRRAMQYFDNELEKGRMSAEQHSAALLKSQQSFVAYFERLAQQYGLIWEDFPDSLERYYEVLSRVNKKTLEFARSQQAVSEQNWMTEHINRLRMMEAVENEREARAAVLRASTRRERREAENEFRKMQEKRLELEIEIALAQLKSTELFKNAIPEVQTQMVQLTVQTIRFRNALPDEDDTQVFRNLAVGANMFGQALAATTQLINQLMSNLTRRELEEVQRRHDLERELIEETLRIRLEAAEEELQAQLFYNGLAQAATQKQHEAAVAHAMRSGNHILIFRAKQAQREFEIRQQYERRRLDAEEEAQRLREEAELEHQRARAAIEHRAAMAAWRLQLANVIASAAQAIIQAFAQLGPIAGGIAAALVTGIGAIQIATVRAQKPQKQTFATGGIVAGNPYRGDTVPIMAKGREMMLTEQDQKNLFDMIREGGGESTIQMTIIFELDSEPIAEKVFDVGSKGNSFIRIRGVVN